MDLSLGFQKAQKNLLINQTPLQFYYQLGLKLGEGLTKCTLYYYTTLLYNYYCCRRDIVSSFICDSLLLPRGRGG